MVEGSALVAYHQEKAKADQPKQSGRETQWRENKDNLWCTHCKKPRHTKEKCWKLNGKPPSREWGSRGGQPRSQAHLAEQPKANEGTEGLETGALNGEELEKIRTLLGSLGKTSEACCLTLSGKPSLSICMNASDKYYAHSWIINSGATDHMTHSSQFFHTYTPCPSNKKIVVANGSLATVAGLGDVFLTPSLILKNVLHVPKLSASLVSIQKLTHDLKCHAIFSPSYCVFQD